ncbi:MAG: threonine/serine dehydratase [Armatimonadota bacterium]|nr:threonine/serine dehydratase [Armatimonadota bacterium]MDR7531937.1 threonine/serine dehydratase [Armatimonadota bacterium]
MRAAGGDGVRAAVAAVPGIDDVRAAAARIARDVRRTPLHPFDGAAGVVLKLENLQPTGSFKVRGAANHMRALAPALRGVITASSGNHGQAVAYVAFRMGVPAVVVVPETVAAPKAAGIARWGAEVIRYGTTASERLALADELAARRGLHLVPPFDDPLVVAGQGTCGLEIAEQAVEAAVVVVPVSGGGLISGVALALKALRPEILVVGAEPRTVARFTASRAAGARVAVPSTDTVCDGLRVQQPGVLPWEITTRCVDAFVQVDDPPVLEAVARLWVEAHLVVEPSGAIALAALLEGAVTARPAVAVVSGGNLDPALIANLRL